MGSSGRRKQRWCTNITHHQPLTPLMEGPDLEMQQQQQERSKKESSWEAIREWFRVQKWGSMPDHHHHHHGALTMRNIDAHSAANMISCRKDLRLLLGVLACPLAPIPLPLNLMTSNNLRQQHNGSNTTTVIPDHHHHHHQYQYPPLIINKHIPLETCTAHYIIQQYLAATGWSSKKQKNIIARNMYAAGTVKMICCQTEVVGGGGGDHHYQYQRRVSRSSRGGQEDQKGCFVVWQMWPGMWSLELVVGGNKVLAGSDSKVVWRHTPWLGTHVAKGPPQRPLRRIIQGLDPKGTAGLFEGGAAQCFGEKRIGEEDCFVIKVAADRASVIERNEGPAAQVIRHVLYGYFSQRSGLLIYLEDSHLTRVLVRGGGSSTATAAVYWETTIGSSIGDYRDVDGVLIAHQGRTVATVFRFGEETTSSPQQHCRTTMEELWTIHDVVFDVPGLSLDCFIPPADIYVCPPQPPPYP